MSARIQSTHCQITRVALGWLLGAFLIAVAPASAEEILFFTNGTSMPIRQHVIRGAMVHVDLGSDGFIAFPGALVLRIEKADAKIKLKGSSPSRPPIGRDEVPTTAGNHPVGGMGSGRRGSVVETPPEGAPATTAGSRPNRAAGAGGSFVAGGARRSAQDGLDRTQRAVDSYRQANLPQGAAGSGASNRRVIGSSKQRGSETRKADVTTMTAAPGKMNPKPKPGKPKSSESGPDGS